VCEGDTEKEYFHFLNQALRGSGITVKVTSDTSDPVAVVARAAQYVTGDPRRGIEAGAYDEVWAVFDWDRKTDRVREALELAAKRKVEVALSNPSFEVWLLWHFFDYRTPGCDQDAVKTTLEAYWSQYVKGRTVDFSQLPKGGRDDAINRAISVATEHERCGRHFPEDRPSSMVHRLVLAILAAWENAHPGRTCPLP
jgi:hypothetical protein